MQFLHIVHRAKHNHDSLADRDPVHAQPMAGSRPSLAVQGFPRGIATTALGVPGSTTRGLHLDIDRLGQPVADRAVALAGSCLPVARGRDGNAGV